MRAMAFDVGSKTIGVAASDALGLIAGGVETIRRSSVQDDFRRIAELVGERGADILVVGYPKNMNGTVGERAQASEAFAGELRQRFPAAEVVLWDERLSTVAAEKVLIEADLRRSKRRKVIDMMAAVVILQNYLDARRMRNKL